MGQSSWCAVYAQIFIRYEHFQYANFTLRINYWAKPPSKAKKINKEIEIPTHERRIMTKKLRKLIRELELQPMKEIRKFKFQPMKEE